MSTRANIILKEGNDKLYFYRHSDGYPKGTLPTLNIFLAWLKSGHIRKDLQQSAGWLIVLGALEYNTLPEYKTKYNTYHSRMYIETDIENIQPPKEWKCGAYEPTTDLHGDIEYLYIIDISAATIEVQEVEFNYETKKQRFLPVSAADMPA